MGNRGFISFNFSNNMLSRQKSSSNQKRKKEKRPTRKPNQVIDSNRDLESEFLFSLVSLVVVHGDANGC